MKTYSEFDVESAKPVEEQSHVEENQCYEQHGWFVFVGDSVRNWRLIYDHAEVKKDELEAGGFCDVTIKRALVNTDS